MDKIEVLYFVEKTLIIYRNNFLYVSDGGGNIIELNLRNFNLDWI